MSPCISDLTGKLHPTLHPHRPPLDRAQVGSYHRPNGCLPPPLGESCPDTGLHIPVPSFLPKFPFQMQKLLYFIKLIFVSPKKVRGLLRGGPCLLHLPALPVHAKKATSNPGMRQTVRPRTILSAMILLWML